MVWPWGLKINRVLALDHSDLHAKFEQNPSMRSWVIVLTDGWTDVQTRPSQYLLTLRFQLRNKLYVGSKVLVNVMRIFTRRSQCHSQITLEFKNISYWYSLGRSGHLYSVTVHKSNISNKFRLCPKTLQTILVGLVHQVYRYLDPKRNLYIILCEKFTAVG